MKINLPVLYHGTDLRIVLMTEEERKTFKEYCKKVFDYMWKLYENSYDEILSGKFKDILGVTKWHNLCNALTVCSANHNRNEQYRYDSFHLTTMKVKAENYARRAFAFGEIGLTAYRMYDAAILLKLSIKEIKEEANHVVRFATDYDNIKPVVFEITDLDVDLLEVENFKSLQHFIDVFGDRLSDIDLIFHYYGKINLNPSNAIYI